jgi:hypothetical protein
MKNKPKISAKKLETEKRTVFYKWCKKRGFIINGYLEEDKNESNKKII